MALSIDLTQNLRYDRLSRLILKRILNADSHCVDIGAHKGEYLHLFIKYAPLGKHMAFEPLPDLYNVLLQKYPEAEIHNCALSDTKGQATFYHVKNAAEYSGLKKRDYGVKIPEFEDIIVQKDRLDNFVDSKIDFIKIDAEGGELDILKGASTTIKLYSPIILFEFGKGASDYYGSRPEDIYDFFTEQNNYRIYTLREYIDFGPSLSLNRLVKLYTDNTEYYFIAVPDSNSPS